jgi:hypothetical protein
MSLKKINENQLRNTLSKKLSYYMILAKIYNVNDLPINLNEKVDSKKINDKYY